MSTDTVHWMRALVGDGSNEWIYEPIQAIVLAGAADELDALEEENRRLLKKVIELEKQAALNRSNDEDISAVARMVADNDYNRVRNENRRLLEENKSLRAYIGRKEELHQVACLIDANSKAIRLCKTLIDDLIAIMDGNMNEPLDYLVDGVWSTFDFHMLCERVEQAKILGIEVGNERKI